MSEKQFEIGPDEAGGRLDKVVGKQTGLSRSEVKRLFEQRQVKIGRRFGAKGDVVQAGDVVLVVLDDEPEDAIPEPEAALNVLLERTDLVIVDKPAGQPTAPLRPGERGTVANALVARYPEMAQVGFGAREPGLIHRLDNDTSGVLVAARTERAFEALVTALKEGRLDKRYLAVCHDLDGMLPDQGTIEIPLAPHPKDRRRVLACLHPRDVERLDPRPATTHYQVQRRLGELVLVELRAPKALRHQIRAHLAAIRCPIAGDVLYGAPSRDGLDRHALHASSLTWGGSAAVPAFAVRSPLPDDLAALVPAEG